MLDIERYYYLPLSFEVVWQHNKNQTNESNIFNNSSWTLIYCKFKVRNVIYVIFSIPGRDEDHENISRNILKVGACSPSEISRFGETCLARQWFQCAVWDTRQ
jgi:hypothetical protein